MNDRLPHNIDNAPSTNGDESTGPVAGQRLAEARRANDISMAEIAKELHLDETKIQALEENQFEVLGAPVFAKGHLRKYADLVGVPVDDMLADYYELNRSVGAPPVVGPRKRKPPLNLAPGPWIAGIAVVVVLAGVLYWWFSRVQAPEVTTRTLGVLEPFASDRNANDADTGSVSLSPDSAADAATAAMIDALPEANAAATGGAAAINLDAEEIPANGPADGVTLVLTFSGNCWTEVTDASGERLFFDLGQAGQTVTLNGRPPLRALFGEHGNVSVTVDGVRFPISGAGRRGNTARVTIDAR